ncbi:MFS transporter [Clavibacter michiganensis]|uniref:MFS transporter n=1 Tax=Clavibacter michiganensis TaxID=28447 RepID=UPI0013FD7896|nr:MFS transporter [Clavibacter michiganensis]
MSSVTLASGAGQVVDFALPLFAGAVLGLTATQTGALLARGLATSFLLRPLGGIAADRYDRTRIAATAALVLGAGYALIAAAGTFPVVLAGVLVSRVGGAFLWVALRATAGVRHLVDPRAFSRLMSAEELGSWVVLAPAIGPPRCRRLRADLRRGLGVRDRRWRAPRIEPAPGVDARERRAAPLERRRPSGVDGAVVRELVGRLRRSWPW